MPADNWRRAAELLEANQPREKVHSDTVSLEQAAQQLQDFLASSDGETALRMLRLATQHIVLAEDREGMGYGNVWFLDGDGLQVSYEAMGEWVAYSKTVPDPVIRSASSRVVVWQTAEYQKIPFDQVVGYIQQQLDLIAQRILSQ